MRRYIQDRRDLIIPNPEQFNRLFDTAIQSSALEAGEDKLGLKAGKKQALNDSLRRLAELTGKSEGQAAGKGGRFGNAVDPSTGLPALSIVLPATGQSRNTSAAGEVRS